MYHSYLKDERHSGKSYKCSTNKSNKEWFKLKLLNNIKIKAHKSMTQTTHQYNNSKMQ